MGMKIASTIIGAEILQGSPKAGHAGTEIPKASFIESLGASLTTDGADLSSQRLGGDAPHLKAGWKFDPALSKGEAQPAKAPALSLARVGTDKVVEGEDEAGKEETSGKGASAPDATRPLPKPAVSGKVTIVPKEPIGDLPVSAKEQETPASKDIESRAGNADRRAAFMTTVETDLLKKPAHEAGKVSAGSEGKARRKREASESKIDKKLADAKPQAGSMDANALIASGESPLASPSAGKPLPAADVVPQKDSKPLKGSVGKVAAPAPRLVQEREAAKQSGDVRVPKQERSPDGTAATQVPEKQSDHEIQDAKSTPTHAMSGADSGEAKMAATEKTHSVQTEIAPSAISNVPQAHSIATSGAEKRSFDAAPSSAHTQVVAGEIARPDYTSANHGTMTATPTALEVGVPGGTHGWLKVRAELAGDGAVHASVSSSTVAGTEMLRRELPTLTSYLHQEQVRVSSIAVHAPQSPTDLSNLASGDGRGHGMSGGSPDPQRQQAGEQRMPAAATREGILHEVSQADGDTDGLLSTGYGVAGGWLSIRA